MTPTSITLLLNVELQISDAFNFHAFVGGGETGSKYVPCHVVPAVLACKASKGPLILSIFVNVYFVLACFGTRILRFMHLPVLVSACTNMCTYQPQK